MAVFSRRRRKRVETEQLDREGGEPGGERREELDDHARRELEEIAEKARAVIDAFEAPQRAPRALDPGYLVPDVAAPSPPDRFAEGTSPRPRGARPTPSGFYDAPTNPYVPPAAAAPALSFDDEEEVTAKVIVDEESLYATDDGADIDIDVDLDDQETLVRPAPLARITWHSS